MKQIHLDKSVCWSVSILPVILQKRAINKDICYLRSHFSTFYQLLDHDMAVSLHSS